MDALDQIVFATTSRDLVGFGGVGPVAASMSRTDGLNWWTRQLEQHVAMEDDGQHGRPGSSLAYLTFESRGAVLHRARGPNRNSRADVTHALVGQEAQVSVRLALGLHQWRWIGPGAEVGPELPPMPVEHLRDQIDAGMKRLAGAARSLPGGLRPLIRASLRNPAKPLAVVTGRLEVDDTLPLVWGMLDILDEVMPNWRWTFSTYESFPGGPRAMRLPNLMFLPRLPHEPIGDRAVVDLTGSEPDETGRVDLDKLLSCYQAEGAQAARQLLRALLDSSPPRPQPIPDPVTVSPVAVTAVQRVTPEVGLELIADPSTATSTVNELIRVLNRDVSGEDLLRALGLRWCAEHGTLI
ncbi:MAG TPA: hypothetical protein VF482_05650, partial [Trebonia sp.]